MSQAEHGMLVGQLTSKYQTKAHFIHAYTQHGSQPGADGWLLEERQGVQTPYSAKTGLVRPDSVLNF